MNRDTSMMIYAYALHRETECKSHLITMHIYIYIQL